MSRRTLEFACVIIVIGLLAGVAGLCTTLLLRFVEHLNYPYSFGTLLSGVTGSSPVRLPVGPMVGGALVATAIILRTWHPRAVGTALN